MVCIVLHVYFTVVNNTLYYQLQWTWTMWHITHFLRRWNCFTGHSSSNTFWLASRGASKNLLLDMNSSIIAFFIPLAWENNGEGQKRSSQHIHNTSAQYKINTLMEIKATGKPEWCLQACLCSPWRRASWERRCWCWTVSAGWRSLWDPDQRIQIAHSPYRQMQSAEIKRSN